MTRSGSAVGGVTPARPSGAGAARRHLLFHAVAFAAVASVGGFALFARAAHVLPDPVAFLSAVAVFAGCQLARIRIRVGAIDVIIGWAEVGAAAVLCLVPPMWAPLTALLASGLVIGPRTRGRSASARAREIFTISVLTVGASAGAAIAGVVGAADEPVRVELSRPLTFLPLVAAGVLQFVSGVCLMAAWLATATGEHVHALWLRVVRAKRLTVAGNTVLGLAAAVLIGVNPLWLVALAPVLWVLHRVYNHQLGVSEDRLTWATLADATRALNQLDERGVALAALRGAARLFRVEQVEVVLARSQGTRRTYRARSGDLLVGSADLSIVDESSEPASKETETDADVAASPPRVMVRRLAIGDSHIGELRLYLRSGVRFTQSEQHAFSTFADAAASAFHDAATHRTLRAMTARSAYDALHDPLTGLPNRSTLLARGNSELHRAGLGVPVALILIDLAGLRQVNDALGYRAGDELLQAVARRLLERQAKDETIGRLGGDEFAILVIGGAGAELDGPYDRHAIERARWLTADIAMPAHVAGVTIAVEASAGVVVEDAGTCDMAELLRRAEVALQHAKREPSRVARYDQGQDAFNRNRLALLADLRDALSGTDQFGLHVQPAVDLRTGQPVGAEALARWRHPDRGVLQPAEFIGTVEHSDLATGFTVHVIDLALGLSAAWAGEELDVPISVNLCARCTLNTDLPTLVAERLAAHAIRPRQLTLEITESVAMTEPGLAERVVVALRDLGIRVCVDDFGTGSASLSFLARFPVDEVKIDRSFVATMVDSAEAAAIVRTSVDLAHSLGLRVVAEGVERPEQRFALLDLGVPAAQGFLFHPPLPVDEATAVLRGAGPNSPAEPVTV